MTGAVDHEIAALDLHALRLGAGVQVFGVDRGAVVEGIDPGPARDVEQHAAPDHLVAHLVDRVLLRTVREPTRVAS